MLINYPIVARKRHPLLEVQPMTDKRHGQYFLRKEDPHCEVGSGDPNSVAQSTSSDVTIVNLAGVGSFSMG
jgi:hypothetical protein